MDVSLEHKTKGEQESDQININDFVILYHN